MNFEERRAALDSSSVFVPSCEAGGRFSPKQCQQGALCWCVDPTGRQLTGPRRPGDGLVCGEDEPRRFGRLLLSVQTEN
uniref:Thyroglobulin type-1 domain-containing protein n=1 Tax=Xiphophorus couchianus TaxID=32473 RepID=A0A3B5N1X0_9TELE